MQPTAQLVHAIGKDVGRLGEYTELVAAFLGRSWDGIILYENPRLDANSWDKDSIRHLKLYNPADVHDQPNLTIYMWQGSYLLADHTREGTLWLAEDGRAYQIINSAPVLTDCHMLWEAALAHPLAGTLQGDFTELFA